jgi:hypothetical protein
VVSERETDLFLLQIVPHIVEIDNVSMVKLLQDLRLQGNAFAVGLIGHAGQVNLASHGCKNGE